MDVLRCPTGVKDGRRERRARPTRPSGESTTHSLSQAPRTTLAYRHSVHPLHCPMLRPLRLRSLATIRAPRHLRSSRYPILMAHVLRVEPGGRPRAESSSPRVRGGSWLEPPPLLSILAAGQISTILHKYHPDTLPAPLPHRHTHPRPDHRLCPRPAPHHPRPGSHRAPQSFCILLEARRDHHGIRQWRREIHTQAPRTHRSRCLPPRRANRT